MAQQQILRATIRPRFQVFSVGMGFDRYKSQNLGYPPVIDGSDSQALHACGLLGLCSRTAGDVAFRFLSLSSLGQFSTSLIQCLFPLNFQLGMIYQEEEAAI